MASQNEDLMEKSSGLRTGRWCNEEDDLLRACVLRYGEGNWHLIPQRSGLKRCRKSCRLRWLNYLKPDIKRGDFSEDEIDMMIRLHRLLGSRWSLIAGRLPGRTANGVKNYWNTHMRERGRHCHGSCQLAEKSEETSMRSHTPITVIKPQAFRFSSRSSSSSWWRENIAGGDEVVISEENSRSRRGPDEGQNQQEVDDKSMEWWKCFDDNDTIGSSSSKSSSMSMTEQEGTFHQLWDQQLSWTDGDFPFLHTSLSDFLA